MNYFQQSRHTGAVMPIPKLEKIEDHPRAYKIENQQQPSVANVVQTRDESNRASQVAEEEEDDEDSDDDDEALARLANSLVVVARRDEYDNIVHEVFLMSPTTGCLSDEPLDLPVEVIERIKSSLTVQSAPGE